MADTYYQSSLTGEEIESRLLGAVVGNAAQSFTSAQKTTARGNIGAQAALTSDSPLALANGGTGASTAAGARSNLGLGTAAVADIDTTLSAAGMAADAAAAGEKIDQLTQSAKVVNQNLFDLTVVREENYYEWVATTTSTWRGNLDATVLAAAEGDVFTLSISDWHGSGTTVIGFGAYSGSPDDSPRVRISYMPVKDTDLDSSGNFIGQFVMPTGTTYVVIQPYVNSSGANPTIGTKYYYRNFFALKGTNKLNSAVKVDASNLTGSGVPRMLGLRYGTKYPNVDTVAQTLTFYTGTTVMDTRGGQLFRLEADTTIQLNSSWHANRIVFDTTEQVFRAINPGADISGLENYIVLGYITRAGSENYPIGRGWIGIPHTIDGYDPYIRTHDIRWDIPNGWKTKVEQLQTERGDKFTFLIQTDTHYYLDQDETIGNTLKALTNNAGFDFAANLGDVIRGYSDETIDSPDNMRAAMTQIMHRYVTGISCPFLVAMGNHDTNIMWANEFSGTPFPLAEVWAREFKPAFNTMPNAVTATGRMYYYLDFNEVRVIMLDTQDGGDGAFGIGDTQLGWLRDTALQTAKAVLVLSHVPLVSGWEVESNYRASYGTATGLLREFKAAGGTVIGCMSGHTHRLETQTVDGLLFVTFKNGGTVAEAVMVDLENKSIKTIAFGFNGERTFSFD